MEKKIQINGEESAYNECVYCKMHCYDMLTALRFVHVI